MVFVQIDFLENWLWIYFTSFMCAIIIYYFTIILNAWNKREE